MVILCNRYENARRLVAALRSRSAASSHPLWSMSSAAGSRHRVVGFIDMNCFYVTGADGSFYLVNASWAAPNSAFVFINASGAVPNNTFVFANASGAVPNSTFVYAALRAVRRRRYHQTKVSKRSSSSPDH